MEEQKWIRVSSPDELKAGMTVKLIGCWTCNREHVSILARPEHNSHSHVVHLVYTCTYTRWVTVQAMCYGKRLICTLRCIPEGRLFRMDVGDLSETTEEKMDRLNATAKEIARILEGPSKIRY
jgi:hypothetical protein